VVWQPRLIDSLTVRGVHVPLLFSTSEARLFTAIERAWRHWNVDRTIKRFGWTGQYVGDYESIPTWVYTIGFLETLSQPEVIIFDISQADANIVLWTLCHGLRDGTRRLVDGEKFIIDDEEVGIFRRLHSSRAYDHDFWLGLAGQRHIRRTGSIEGFEAFQLVLHDSGGHYPWDENYDASLLLRQPALWLQAEKDSACHPDADLAPDVRLQSDGSPGRLDEHIRQEVEQIGVSIVPVDGEGRGPTWAYTTGLHERHGAPELIAFTLSKALSMQLVSEVAAHLVGGRLTLEDGLRRDDLGPPYQICFRRVEPDQYLGFGWFYLTKQYYEQRTGQREAVDAFQIFLPDTSGLFPWEVGCAEEVRRAQPRLFLPFDPNLPFGGALADA
jgi:hypothetical protein